MNSIRPILTITGSDSTGGSGVQADIELISSLGGYAVSAITSITVQNTLGIQAFFDVPAEIISGQIEAVINDVQPTVVKVGMIRTVEAVEVIVDALSKYHPEYVIYDPIVYSTKGERLMDEDVVERVQERLVPLCSLVINQRLSSHGMRNAFSSAIATFLSQGESMEVAIARAKDFVNARMARHERLQGRANELYREFMEILAGHCRKNSDVAFYASSLNVSARYLGQVTRKIAGKTPKNLIDEYLVEEVEKQLATTEMTVQEVAYAFGFSSQAHFTKFFKKMKGITPSQYRKKT